MITDVAIDVDGVLFDFAGVVTKHFSDYFGTELPAPKNWEFFEDWGLSAEAFYTLLDHLTVEREIFNEGSPIPKTMVGWQAMREQGLRLHVITHRSWSAHAQTIQWLERYQLIPDSLHFTGDKAPVLASLALDEFASIDDHYDQYAHYKAYDTKAFLFTQPWNAGHPGRRVSNLVEFADAIKLYNQYWSAENAYTLMDQVF